MLPSVRLIVATFCCGFLIVFAGVRLATSVNGLNQAIPVMAAHAAPIRLTAITDQDQGRGAVMVPVTYDLRFAVSATQPAPTTAAASPVIDRAAPLLMPLVILPPIAQEAVPAETPEKSETTTVAALPSQPATEPAPATIDIPLPEPATVDLTFSPPPVKTKDSPAIAAVGLAPLPAQPSPVIIDIPLPEPVAVDLTFSPSPAPESAPEPAKSDTEIGPKSEAAPEPRPETDARAGSDHESAHESVHESAHELASERDAEPITVAALLDDIPPGTVKLPTKHIPLPQPKAVERKPAERTAALHPLAAHRPTRSAAAKAKPRRRAVAKRDDFDSFFNFPAGEHQ